MNIFKGFWNLVWWGKFDGGEHNYTELITKKTKKKKEPLKGKKKTPPKKKKTYKSEIELYGE